MDFYDEEIVGEGPCEFCGESFPLMMLIEHETTHMDPVTGSYQNLEEFLEPEEIQTIIEESTNKVPEPKVIIEQKRQSPAENQGATSSDQSTVKIEDSISKVPIDSDEMEQKNSSIKEKPKEVKKLPTQKIKEFTTECGANFFNYGPDIDQDKDLENEKQTYKMPDNPLLNSISKEEDTEDINNLSDDDCNESLEEFWKRARDYLKRNRIKSEC